jgi:hypothetical protein
MIQSRVAPAPSVPQGEAEALDDMVEVLRVAASIRAPDRAMAVRYTQARERLVSGRLRGFLPPFLTQCASVQKYVEFIGLFAPDAPRRIEFVEQAFEPARRAAGFTRGYDVFAGEA